MENDILKIADKLRKSANDILVDLRNKVNYFNHIYELKLELSEIDDLETLCCFSAKEIIDILNTIAPSYKVDSNELEASLFFYSDANYKKIAKNKKRYMDATMLLAEIKGLFDRFVQQDWNNFAVQKEKVESDIVLFSKLIDLPLKDGKLVCEVLPLQKYDALVRNGWSDSEKIALYSMLVKSHIEFLKTDQVIRDDEIAKQEDVKFDEAAERVNAVMSEKMEEVIIEKHKLNVDEDIIKKINDLKHFLKKYREDLDIKLENDNMATLYSDFKSLFDAGSMSLEDLHVGFIPSTFNLFFAYCLSCAIDDFDLIVNDEYEEYELESAKLLLSDALKNCSTYAKILTEEETKANYAVKELEPTIETLFEDEFPNKLVFYTVGGGDSEFERSIKDMPPEKLKDLSSIITKLRQNSIRNANTLSRGNNNKIKYLSHGHIFVTFRVLSNNHILVYFVESIDEINRKAKDTKLDSYSLAVEDKINSIIIDGVSHPEGTIPYRKLMEQSKKIMTDFNKKTSDMGKGDYHV